MGWYSYDSILERYGIRQPAGVGRGKGRGFTKPALKRKKKR